jgi:tetratricopeptide (TPR) repeat protein
MKRATARGTMVMVAVAALGAAFGASCAGPPWFMGAPLDGQPSIPATRKNLSFKEQRVAAATARTKGQTVFELGALLVLDDLERLLPEQRERLAGLLERRAIEFHALGRAIPESRDLARLARLAPARGAGLLGERASAERAAGDAWLAIGATEEARAAYEWATQLGATDMDFRVRALWGHPPPETTTLAELRVAIQALPLRAVPPLALAYVTHGGSERATLARSLAAARQEKLEGLAVRVGDALRGAASEPQGDFVDGGGPSDGGTSDAAPEDAAVAARPTDAFTIDVPAPTPVPGDLDAWVLRGTTVSARLVPIIRTHPDVLGDVPRAVGWVDLLLAEDETSPEILELAALVFGRAARFGGTERMLMELAYATPDRAEGLARGAAVWERLGRGREACAQWIHAARWRDDAEDPTWRKAISCARRDPGAGDWREIRKYVLGRARPERRAALAATLDLSP